MQASVEEKKEPKDADPKKRVKGAAGGFLSRYKMLFGGSLAVAIAVVTNNDWQYFNFNYFTFSMSSINIE